MAVFTGQNHCFTSQLKFEKKWSGFVDLRDLDQQKVEFQQQNWILISNVREICGSRCLLSQISLQKKYGRLCWAERGLQFASMSQKIKPLSYPKAVYPECPLRKGILWELKLYYAIIYCTQKGVFCWTFHLENHLPSPRIWESSTTIFFRRYQL